MIFEEKKPGSERFVKKAGYLFSYFLFTTILFYILSFLDKIPASWTYFHIMGITLLITLIGMVIRRRIK